MKTKPAGNPKIAVAYQRVSTRLRDDNEALVIRVNELALERRSWK